MPHCLSTFVSAWLQLFSPFPANKQRAAHKLQDILPMHTESRKRSQLEHFHVRATQRCSDPRCTAIVPRRSASVRSGMDPWPVILYVEIIFDAKLLITTVH